MSATHYAWFIIPEKNMTSGRFAALMESFQDMPNSVIHDYHPEDPDELLFTSGPYESPVIDGFDMYSFDSSTTYDSRSGAEIPKGIETLLVATEGKQFYDDEARSDAYVDILGRFFSGMGAMYAVGGSEYAFEETETIRDLKKVVEGVHIFSDELVEVVGREKIEKLGTVSEIEGGLILRTSKGDLYGPDIEEAKVRTVLNKIWKEVGVLSSKDFKKFPESRYRDLFYPSGLFFWAYQWADIDLKGAARGFFEEHMTLDQTKEEDKKPSTMSPEKVDELFDKFTKGMTSNYHSMLSVTNPPTKLKGIGGGITITSGLPGIKTYGAQYERDDATSILMALGSGAGTSDATLFSLVTELRIFVNHFKPVYGMGHYRLELFHTRSGRHTAPETRIWPINVFDLNAFDAAFEHRLRAYWTENADRWMLVNIHDRSVAFIANNLGWGEIPDFDEATLAIFGELKDLTGPINAYLQGLQNDLGGGSP